MKNKHLTLLFLIILTLATGCDSDPIDPDPPTSETHVIFVGNQGAFGHGNASMTVIDPEDETATEHFQGQMSNVIQGMALMNDNLYVTGNSNSINIIDPESREVVGQIVNPAFGTARYFAQVGEILAYVTTQDYSGADSANVYVIDLTSNTVEDSIAVPLTDGSANPDGIAVNGSKAFVAQGSAFTSSTTIGVIDTETHSYSHAIDIGCVARYVVVDDDGEVLAACTDTQEIIVIDPDTEDVSRIDVEGGIGSLSGHGQDAVVAQHEDGETVYFLSSDLGVISFDPDAHSITGTIEVDTENAGSLGFDPQTETVYIGHADPDGPFSANGSVTVHELSGSEVASYNAGVYPAYISVYASPELVALR